MYNYNYIILYMTITHNYLYDMLLKEFIAKLPALQRAHAHAMGLLSLRDGSKLVKNRCWAPPHGLAARHQAPEALVGDALHEAALGLTRRVPALDRDIIGYRLNYRYSYITKSI